MFGETSKPSTTPRGKCGFTSDSGIHCGCLEYEEQVDGLTAKKLCEACLHHQNFHTILSPSTAMPSAHSTSDGH